MKRNLSSAFSCLRKYLANVAVTRPAYVILFCVCSVTLPAVLCGNGLSLSFRAAAVCATVFSLLSPIFLPLKSSLFRAVLPCFFALLSVFLHVKNDAENVLDNAFSGDGASAEVEFVCADTSTTSLSWMNSPGNVLCKAKRFRLSGGKDWTACDEPVMVRFTVSSGKPRVEYGDSFLAEGRFMRCDLPVSEHAFDYGKYLRRQGIKMTYSARSVTVTGQGTGVVRFLADSRDKLLDKVCGKMEDKSLANLASGMLFGFRQGADNATKRSFIRSGTIHILTVSGTHVAIFAAVAMLLLAFVPFRTRFMLVAALTFFYALSTGFREPAIRAYVMLASYLILRAFLYKSSAGNILALSAAALLVVNPWNCTSAGFQYSFLTVAALLSCGNLSNAFSGVLEGDARLWCPWKYRTKGNKVSRYFIRAAVGSLAACFAAFLVTGAISLVYQGFAAPASFVANLILIPVSWLIFAAFACSSIFSFIPVAGFLGGKIIAWLLSFMTFVCGVLGDCGNVPLPSPGAWSVILFICLVFVLLKSRRIVIASIAASIMTLIALSWFFMPYSGGGSSCEAALITGPDRPCIVIADHASNTAFVLDVPSYDSAMAAEAFLLSRGIRSCDKVVSLDGSEASLGGFKYFVRRTDVKEIVVSEDMDDGREDFLPFKRSHLLRTRGDGEYYSSPNLKTLRKDGIVFFSFVRSGEEFSGSLELLPTGEWSFRLTGGKNGVSACERISPSRETVTTVFDLEKL